jgi:hypothetical protein
MIEHFEHLFDKHLENKHLFNHSKIIFKKGEGCLKLRPNFISGLNTNK